MKSVGEPSFRFKETINYINIDHPCKAIFVLSMLFTFLKFQIIF